MDRERLQREGRLSLRAKEAKALEMKCKGLIDSVRLQLDPLEKIEELDMELAFQEMADLMKTFLEYREALEDIKAIKKALGK